MLPDRAQDAVEQERSATLRRLFRDHRDLRDALPKASDLLKEAMPSLPRTAVPGTWQLGVQSELGSRLAIDPTGIESELLFDCGSGIIAHPADNQQVTLTKEQARLLRLLVLAGDVGLGTDEFEQALCERDTLDSQQFPNWPDAEDRSEMFRRALGERAVLLKHRLQIALRQLGLSILSQRSRWHLPCHQRVRLINTPWQAPEVPRPPISRPLCLRGQESFVWDLLVQHWPSIVGLDAMAKALGRSNDSAGREYAAKVISRLRARLRTHTIPVDVIGHHTGSYRLVLPDDQSAAK